MARSVLAPRHSVDVSKPKGTLWPLKRHTLAKHHLLIGYLDAWVGIVGHKFPHALLVDGFAGPGEYEGREKGSPLKILDAYLLRPDRDKLRTYFKFLFIEQDEARATYLRGLVEEAEPRDGWNAEVVHGDFADVLPGRLADFRTRHPNAPVFAFIDPFGAGDEAADLASELIAVPRSEVLIYIPTTFLHRFTTREGFDQTMDRLFGSRERWEAAGALVGDARKQFLQNAFEDRMRESYAFVRAFEIVPKDGRNGYTLFFGTGKELGLRRMKASMWKLDPYNGASFRDSATVDHPVLFDPKPDLARLERDLSEHFESRAFPIEEAEDFTLHKTAFRDDAHLKQTLAKAERENRLELVSAKEGRKPGTFPPGTVVQFAMTLL